MKRALIALAVILLMLSAFLLGIRTHALLSRPRVVGDSLYIEFGGFIDEYTL